MAIFCIEREVAEKLKTAVKNGEVNISKMLRMKSSDRREIFAKVMTPELAKFVNGKFEEAMVSKQKDALRKWAEETLNPIYGKNKNYKSVLDRINELDELGALNEQSAEGFLTDLVALKLGAELKPEEVNTIIEKTKGLETLWNQKDADGFVPVEYWEKRKEADDYIDSLDPSSALRVTTGTTGRGVMLASIKSPFLNIASNIVQGAVEAATRRISGGEYKGLNDEFAKKFLKYAIDVYVKSGYDVTRLETMSWGRRRLGEEMTHTQGGGVFHKVARGVENSIFKYGMGFPDVVSSALAFVDSVNLTSTKLAKEQGLSGEQARAKALEIFKEAIDMDSSPKSDGAFAREQGIADARYATFTNKGKIAELSLGLRTLLNKASGDARIGDLLMPFVKTPANVIQATIDYNPIGLVNSATQYVNFLKSGDTNYLRSAIRSSIRAGVGTALTAIIALGMNPDDFVGAYDNLTSEDKQRLGIDNAVTNAIRVNGKWISLDYFGPLASTFVGIMYARKYGKNPLDKSWQALRGSLAQSVRMPGMKETTDFLQGSYDILKEKNIADSLPEIGANVVDFVSARTIPAILSDIAKGTTEFEKKAKTPVEKVKAKIPLLRNQLPDKVNQITGKKIPSEGMVSSLLFGGRVKTAQGSDDPVVKEILRLSDKGEMPTVSDIERGQRFKDLKKLVPAQRYENAVFAYSQQYYKKAKMLLNTAKYRRSDDAEKSKLLDSVRNKDLEKTLKKFGYTKKKAKLLKAKEQ